MLGSVGGGCGMLEDEISEGLEAEREFGGHGEDVTDILVGDDQGDSMSQSIHSTFDILRSVSGRSCSLAPTSINYNIFPAAKINECRM